MESWTPSFDQVQDGFRLDEVDLPVQIGASGELARVGLSRAGGDAGLEEQGRSERAAVATQLYDVFSGITSRSGEHGHDDLVDRVARHWMMDPENAVLARAGDALGA